MIINLLIRLFFSSFVINGIFVAAGLFAMAYRGRENA